MRAYAPITGGFLPSLITLVGVVASKAGVAAQNHQTRKKFTRRLITLAAATPQRALQRSTTRARCRRSRPHRDPPAPPKRSTHRRRNTIPDASRARVLIELKKRLHLLLHEAPATVRRGVPAKRCVIFRLFVPEKDRANDLQTTDDPEARSRLSRMRRRQRRRVSRRRAGPEGAGSRRSIHCGLLLLHSPIEAEARRERVPSLEKTFPAQ